MEQSSMFFLLVTSVPLFSVFCFGEEQVRMTILSKNHFKSEEDSHYQCRLSDPDNDPDEITMESLRTGWTRDTAAENPDPPNVVYYEKVSYPYHRVEMINNGSNNAFGVFACTAAKAGKSETMISTTRMRSDAVIVPSNGLFTQTVSIGDTNVTIRMMNTTGTAPVEKFRWTNNTYFWTNSTSNHGVDTFTIDEPIQLHHEGIYECFISGQRSLAKHGLNLLVVRACPSTRWGPPDCEGVCDSCYNGGVCNENTGKCVCAPGFQGENCLSACGGNRYGYTCEKRCTNKEDDKAKCMGKLFCLVHPFGCRCNTGFGGLDCENACDENTFGASCMQSCHCTSDECNQYTGECEGTETSCDIGWAGANCQECEDGYFGLACDQECHCSPDKCNRESGFCQTGGCLPQWLDLFPPYSCQTGIYLSAYTKVNSGVAVPVNCTAVEGPLGSLTVFGLVLSRRFDSLDETNIYTEDVFSMGNTKTVLFKVENVEQSIDLFCQLRKNNERVAVLNISIGVYVLPELVAVPNFVTSTSTTITISWVAWDIRRNKGTPPVIGYNLYHKLRNESDWKDVAFYHAINGQDEYYATVKYLNPDTLYDFSVAALREGTGGEGPRSPALEEQKTSCNPGPPEPEGILAKVTGERQERVEISWQVNSCLDLLDNGSYLTVSNKLPSEGIGCSSGIIKYTVYYSSDDEVFSVNVLDPTASSFIVADLTPGFSYTFHVTLSTSGGESDESDTVERFVPVLPSLNNLPTLRGVTCNSVTIEWEKWTNETDQGTPPVVHYIPYHRMNASYEWISGGVVAHKDSVTEYQFTFWKLVEDSSYEFCVVVVREGYGGEGDKNNVVKQNTALCSASPVPVATSIAIPVTIFLIIIAAAISLFKRCQNNPKRSSTPMVSVKANDKNSGHKGPQDSISFIEGDVKQQQHTHTDKRPRQRKEDKAEEQTAAPTVTHSYENPNIHQSSTTITSANEENPYEIPDDSKDFEYMF